MKRNAFLKYALLAGTVFVASCENSDAPHKRDTVDFVATLSGGAEVPPNNSPATGTVAVTYNKANRELQYTINYSGLTSNLVAAHFHVAPPGVNGPVVIPITIGPSPITGRVTLTDIRENNSSAIRFRAQDLENFLFAQGMYVNLHTQRFPGGEIRGDISRKEF